MIRKAIKSQRKEKHFELGGKGIPDKRNITLKGIELQISMVCSEYDQNIWCQMEEVE